MQLNEIIKFQVIFVQPIHKKCNIKKMSSS